MRVFLILFVAVLSYSYKQVEFNLILLLNIGNFVLCDFYGDFSF